VEVHGFQNNLFGPGNVHRATPAGKRKAVHAAGKPFTSKTTAVDPAFRSFAISW